METDREVSTFELMRLMVVQPHKALENIPEEKFLITSLIIFVMIYRDKTFALSGSHFFEMNLPEPWMGYALQVLFFVVIFGFCGFLMIRVSNFFKRSIAGFSGLNLLGLAHSPQFFLYVITQVVFFMTSEASHESYVAGEYPLLRMFHSGLGLVAYLLTFYCLAFGLFSFSYPNKQIKS